MQSLIKMYQQAFIIMFHMCLYVIFDHLLYFMSKKDNNYNITKRSKYKNIEYCKKINLYSLSSFSYSLVGFLLLKFPLHIHYYDAFYSYFLIVQGIISYLSDSVYIDQVHWTHRIDPSFA